MEEQPLNFESCARRKLTIPSGWRNSWRASKTPWWLTILNHRLCNPFGHGGMMRFCPAPGRGGRSSRAYRSGFARSRPQWKQPWSSEVVRHGRGHRLESGCWLIASREFDSLNFRLIEQRGKRNVNCGKLITHCDWCDHYLRN
jgi:hypothetical protein